MPIIITSNTFADEYNAGTTDVFQGNVSDKINVETDFYYENTFDASLSSVVKLEFYSGLIIGTAQYSTNAAIDISSFAAPIDKVKELLDKEITITNTKAAYNGTANVIDIIGDYVILDISYVVAGSNSFNNGKFYVSTPITAFDYEYSYDKSGDQDYTGALSNNLIQTLYTTNSIVLDHTNTTPVALAFKTRGSYQIGTATIEGANLGVAERQGFTFKHTLEILPIAEADNTSLSIDFTTGYKGKLLPKALFNSIPMQDIGVTIAGEIYQEKVGILDTNLGTANTNYSFSSFDIVRTSDSQASGVPIVEEQFTVTFDIDNTADAPFSNTNTLVKVGIENIPDRLTSFNQNFEQHFVYDRVIAALGDAPASGEASGDAASITNYTATFNSSSSISISFDVLYTANAQTQINAQSVPNFAIFCSTQDHTLTYITTDRINLKVFEGVGINKLLDDPVQIFDNQYVTHPYQNVQATVGTIDGFPVQDLVASTTFFIDWTGRPDLRLNTITQSIVIKNTSTGEEIDLDETNIPVNAFPLINNENPDANYSIEKGFKIPANEVRNRIEMFNVTNPPTTPEEYYVVSFPFFIRWEYYKQLILSNIPRTLLDFSEPFKGINYFLHRYDTIADWDIFYRLKFSSTESGQSFEQVIDNQITTTDYNQHPDVLSRSVLSYAEDKVTPLLEAGTNFIESTQKTFIEAKWEMSSTPVVGDFEICFFIEAFENGSPTSIQRISSANGLLPSSWFTDTGAGDGLIEKAVDGDTAIGRAYIDNTKLQLFDNYRLYPAIYLPALVGSEMLAEDGTDFLTEGGDNFIPE